MLLATFTMTIRDAKNKSGYVRYIIDLDDATWNTNDQILTDATAYLQEVASRTNELIRGAITDLSLTLSLGLPGGIRASPELDADVEETATFTYEQPGIPIFKNSIPTFDHAKFPTGSIDLAPGSDADVSYLVNLLVNSTEALDWAGEYGGITNSRGDVLDLLPRIKKTFK